VEPAGSVWSACQFPGLYVRHWGQSHSAEQFEGHNDNDRSPDGDHYCFDLTFTPVNVVVSAGLNGSYIVADVVGPNTLPSDQAAAMCGTTAVDAVVYFPSGVGGFYATFN
jgi:hypothetical protein